MAMLIAMRRKATKHDAREGIKLANSLLSHILNFILTERYIASGCDTSEVVAIATYLCSILRCPSVGRVIAYCSMWMPLAPHQIWGHVASSDLTISLGLTKASRDRSEGQVEGVECQNGILMSPKPILDQLMVIYHMPLEKKMRSCHMLPMCEECKCDYHPRESPIIGQGKSNASMACSRGLYNLEAFAGIRMDLYSNSPLGGHRCPQSLYTYLSYADAVAEFRYRPELIPYLCYDLRDLFRHHAISRFLKSRFGICNPRHVDTVMYSETDLRMHIHRDARKSRTISALKQLQSQFKDRDHGDRAPNHNFYAISSLQAVIDLLDKQRDPFD
jgi:hypothetical protein